MSPLSLMQGLAKCVVDLSIKPFSFWVPANSDDPDEMPHNAAFHQGLHYWLRSKKISRDKKKH